MSALLLRLINLKMSYVPMRTAKTGLKSPTFSANCRTDCTRVALDYDSEGLILVTNDGETANRLMHPRYGANKPTVCSAPVNSAAVNVARLERGIQLDDGLTAPARVRILRSHDEKDL